ncbi:MAG: DegT/DnrJ/EryC1/StrS family aminotransferase, partial [Acidobacteriota bacterium]
MTTEAVPPVPFVDLRLRDEALRGEIQEALSRVFERGRFILGPEVESFEREFASFVGSAHAVGVGCGTDA